MENGMKINMDLSRADYTKLIASFGMINFQDNVVTLCLWTLAKYLLFTWETPS